MINVDINKRFHQNDFTMSNLHSHPFYEIYYLSKGSRLFFFKNSMNEISEPTMIIIPPHTLHKTEGGPFIRYNILVSPKHQLIKQGVIYLDAYYNDPSITVKQLAHLCNMSEEYFRKLYKEVYGIPPHKAIIDKRINEACHMLQSGYFSIIRL